MTSEEIWVVDDDRDDQDLIKDICHELSLPRAVRCFDSAEEFLNMLAAAEEAPFLILCDVNLSKINGFTLREKLLRASERKFHSVPFIFWSGVGSAAQVDHAFRVFAHGFFIKPPEYYKWKNTLRIIIEYWSQCETPPKQGGFDQPLK